MGLKDLVNKLKLSDDTTLEDIQAPDANDNAGESEENASVGQDDAGVEASANDTTASNEPSVPTREELEERFSDAAEAFALRMVVDNRIVPAQQANAVVEFINARIDDTMHGGVVSFIDATGELVKGTREAQVVARYSSMPKHTLTQERLKAVKEGQTSAKVLTETDTDKVSVEGPLSPERRAQLLAASEQGQRVLARQ